MADKVSVQVVIKNVRLSFPKLSKAQVQNGVEKWSACFLIDDRKGSPQKANVKELNTAVKKIRDEVFDGKKVASPFRKADGTSEYFEEGTLFINAAAYKTPPNIVDNKRRPADAGDQNMFYAGARVTAVLTLYPQFAQKRGDTNLANRINAGLEIVQFVGHDERLGGSRPDPESILEDVEVDDEPPGDPGDKAVEDDDDFDVS